MMMTIFDSLSDDHIENIYNICNTVRDELVYKYDDELLMDKCIEVSEEIYNKLSELGYDVDIIDGYCIFDIINDVNKTYAEHSWVELYDDNNIIYIDISASQFQKYINEDIPDIIIGNKPYYMSYTN